MFMYVMMLMLYFSLSHACVELFNAITQYNFPMKHETFICGEGANTLCK